MSTTVDHTPVERPDAFYDVTAFTGAGAVERPLPWITRVFNRGWLRKLSLIVALACIWQLYATLLDNDLLFPTFAETVRAFTTNIANGVLPNRAWSSVRVLLMGYGIGVGLATILSVAAINTRIGNDLLETLTSMFNPLPAIALLPLALLWFGLGNGSLVFVLIHSVLWVVALNMHAGFLGVSSTLRMVGRNYGLRGIRYVITILIPAAFPSILTGLKGGLGVRLAHADRRRARLRRRVRRRGPRLVHLREQEPARDPGGVRRAAERHPDRPRRREPRLPHHRTQDRQPLGHAALKLPLPSRERAGELGSLKRAPTSPETRTPRTAQTATP